MRGPNQDILKGERPPGGFLVPKPHNDVAPTPGQPKALAAKEVVGLLLVSLGLILNLIWIGVLGWLAVELVIWPLKSVYPDDHRSAVHQLENHGEAR